MKTRYSAQAWAKVATGVSAVLAASLLAGCTAGAKRSNIGSPEATNAHAATTAPACCSQSLATVPPCNEAIAILQAALTRCDTLEGYEIVFHRQERRGLLNKLSDWEDMKVCYRKQPRAIKMTWLDPQSEYQECIYVEGVNDGKVTVLPRKGLFGLPATPLSVPPEMAVTMGKALRPITEFGLASLLRHTLDRMEEAKSAGGATVTYEGTADVEKIGAKAQHVVICYPPGFGRSGKQDIYIDAETGYPAGSYQWLPNGDLLAAYLYEKPTLTVPKDDIFAIRSAKTLVARE